MKLFISIDMEGIGGVAVTADVAPTGSEYGRFRRLMTAEANAAIAGAFAGGATEVVINDSHWTMTNLIHEELDPRALYIKGGRKPMSMMEGLEPDFAGAFFIGYHARASHPRGVLSHTMMGQEILDLRLDGRPVGELGWNAAIAASMGVPALLVTGDDALAAEAAETVPGIRTVTVKHARGRFAAAMLHPSAVQERIRAAAAEATAAAPDAARPRLAGPHRVSIEFASAQMAVACSWIPTVRQVAWRSIEYTAADMAEAMRTLRVIEAMAEKARDSDY